MSGVSEKVTQIRKMGYPRRADQDRYRPVVYETRRTTKWISLKTEGTKVCSGKRKMMKGIAIRGAAAFEIVFAGD